MADNGGLQLLPETRKKIDIRVPGENRMIVIGSIFLIITLVLITGLYLYKNSLESELSSLDTQIVALEQKRDKKTEQSILVFNKQATLLSKLLNDHVYWTTGFSKIERLVQNQVQFENITTSLADNKVDFKAIAANYTTIARQIAAFASDESIEDVTLSKVNALTNGQLEFSMKISFNKNKFLKKQ